MRELKIKLLLGNKLFTVNKDLIYIVYINEIICY